MTFSFSVLGLGFVTAIALIAAVGAQNAFLLRHALRGAIPVWPLVVVCIVSEMGLITLGVTGAGAVMASAPWAMTLITWFGVVFLVSYGIFALRRAWVGGSALEAPADTEKAVAMDRERETVAAGATAVPAGGSHGSENTDGPALSGGDVALAEPALPVGRDEGQSRPRFGGPLLAAIGGMLAFTWLNPHAYIDSVVVLGSVANGHGDLRWAFALGCFLAGITWFCLVGFGGKALRGLFANPVAWRVLDVIIAVVMFAMAAMLALH